MHQVSGSFAKEKIFRKMGGNLIKVKPALSFSYPNVFFASGCSRPKCCSESSLGPGSAVVEKSQKMVSKEKYQQAKRAKRWPGEGEKVAEPGDMPLLLPFRDSRFWYHALIGQMPSC